MSITFHPDLEARLRARAEGAYIERLLRADQQVEEELENLALAGLNSGELMEKRSTILKGRLRTNATK
jgi:hypothetical protein